MSDAIRRADQSIEQITSSLNRIKDLKDGMVAKGRDPKTQGYGIVLLEVKVHTIRLEVIAKLTEVLTATGSEKMVRQLKLRIDKLTQLGNKE